MNSITEQSQNVPELRFPKFSGEWEKKKLGEIAFFKAGYAFKSVQMLSEKSSYQLLKMSNVYKSELRLDRNPSYWGNISSKEKEFLLKEGDNILTLTGTVGKQDYGYSVQIKKSNKYLLNQRLVLLREIKNISNNDFISQIISCEKFLYYFFGEAKGGTGNQTNVSIEDVKEIQLFFPTLPEQQKIASFFTVIDKRISELQQKKSLLQEYKKGIMQKIFAQELRFKDSDGKDFPDWEEKNGSDLFETISNKEHNSDLPILAISQEFGAVPREMINYKISVTDKSIESYKVVEIGDFIISLRSFQGGIEYSNYKGICSPAYIILRNTKPISYVFFKYYFKTDFYIQKLCEKLEGIRDGKMISYKYFSEIELPYPILKEQTKIAEFLSAIDDKIKHTQIQIENTEQYKKGLLQSMFV